MLASPELVTNFESGDRLEGLVSVAGEFLLVDVAVPAALGCVAVVLGAAVQTVLLFAELTAHFAVMFIPKRSRTSIGRAPRDLAEDWQILAPLWLSLFTCRILVDLLLDLFEISDSCLHPFQSCHLDSLFYLFDFIEFG